MKNVYDYIEKNLDRYIEELTPLLKQKSISETHDGIDECAELVGAMLRENGIPAKVYQTSGNPIVFGEVKHDDNAPTVLIYGHYDVMPVEPLDQWRTEPFTPTIIDGKLYCRGASDDKGQSFTYIKGYEAYREIMGGVPVNVKFIFDGEEEIGSPSLLPFVQEHKEMLRADVLLSSDSKIHDSGRPIIFLGLKGMCSVDIEISCSAKDLHSMYASVAPSPVWRMIGLLNTLKGEDGFVRIEGFYDNAREPSALELEAVAKIPVNEQNILDNLGLKKLLRNRKTDDYYYNNMFEPTCNIGYFGAGHEHGVKDIVPSKAAVRLDMNLVPNQRPDEILEKLRRHLDKHGYADVAIKPFSQMVPYKTPVDDPYVPFVAECVEAVWGKEPVILPSIGGFGPNFVFTETLGMPNIYLPMAALDNSNHAPNESLVLSGFLNGVKVFATILDRLARMERAPGAPR